MYFFHCVYWFIGFESFWLVFLRSLWCLCCSNSARFVWKNVPRVVKENRPEVTAAWKIGQRLWTRDYAGVYEAIREFNGSPEAQSLVDSFSGKLILHCCITCNCMSYFDLLCCLWRWLSNLFSTFFLSLLITEILGFITLELWQINLKILSVLLF